MSQANRPSFVTLPSSTKHRTVLEFLAEQFPHIDSNVWKERMMSGKVFWRDSHCDSNSGSNSSSESGRVSEKSDRVIDETTPYQPNRTLGYYREVTEEPQIPFDEMIVEHNNHFLIAHKPHFLPVMPGGQFVNECLQERLIKRTGIKELQAVHRLDRDTAGLVMFSTNPETRGEYHQLFSEQKIKKAYQAIAKVPDSRSIVGKTWHIKNHVARGELKFRFKNTNDSSQGQYAESLIECVEQNQDLGLFKLSPITGRTHQLRLHMMDIGYPILNDRFYPELQPKEEDNYQSPLQLLAKTLQFIDPLDKKDRTFNSPLSLSLECS